MRTKEAVAQRILEQCRERHIAVNALANISGVSPSTIYSMLNQKARIRAWCPSRKSATVLKLPSESSLTARCLMKLNKR